MAKELDNVLAIILGGGKGTRLYPLTKYRAKPAVPIAGKFRIIDIAVSNCLNSGIDKIFILTQFNTHSLHRHIYDTFQLGQFSKGFVDILAAQQTIDNTNWYQGTADAVRQNLSFIEDVGAEYIIILSGDHLYRMDYASFLNTHINKNSDITISVSPVTRKEAKSFGIVQVDENDKVINFYEKPQDEALLDEIKSLTNNTEKSYLASMGIYIFSRNILLKILKTSDAEDFGKHIIPSAIKKYSVFAYRFEGYWRDIGTIKSFFDANLELASLNPPFSFYDQKYPIYTRQRSLPGSRIQNCHFENVLIADGCYISKCIIKNSVIGLRSIIRDNCSINRTIIMGADYYEQSPLDGSIPIGIGNNCIIENAIIDKNARIGNNVKLINKEKIEYSDNKTYSVVDGIIVVPKNTTIPDNTVI
ncbi:MAG: glucose-1-phosphate adenylyltransferase [Candidatus Marinimicrobia bacterium]|nr:glucose-1-phosphate adenylyltransferase [Candidatus Neomarinimicrobiota bacterium]